MRMPLHNGETAIKSRAEQRGAHLTHTTAHALNGLIAIDDRGFGVAILQADIGQVARHREGLARSDQQPMVSLRS